MRMELNRCLTSHLYDLMTSLNLQLMHEFPLEIIHLDIHIEVLEPLPSVLQSYRIKLIQLMKMLKDLSPKEELLDQTTGNYETVAFYAPSLLPIDSRLSIQ